MYVMNRFFRFCLSFIITKTCSGSGNVGPCHQMELLHRHTCFHLFPQGTARLHSPHHLHTVFFLSTNTRSDNFTGSSFKTTPGFLLREGEVKGYRTIANSIASCLSGILELHREVWVGGRTSICARPTHF